MWKDKAPGFCACPLIYIQNKLLLVLLFQSHKAQETQKLVLVRENCGSGHGPAGSIVEKQFDGYPGLSAADSVHFLFFHLGTIRKMWKSSSISRSALLLIIYAKTDGVLKKGKANSSSLQIRPRKWEM